MCSGRVDLSFILRAFRKGADGVAIGGCWPGECHYVTEGNYDALGNVLLTKRLLSHLGIDPGRLRLEWISAAEGNRFAEVMSEFSAQTRQLGPLGESEGLDARTLHLKLDAALELVPYLKLVEREKLRVPVRSEEAYEELYTSGRLDALFEELVADKLAVSQIMLLLEQQPLSTAEIAERLGLEPSAVSRYMNVSSRQGLVRYDLEQKCYARA
jgi:coenzyme F420-reducing hydrogenase delta subunit